MSFFLQTDPGQYVSLLAPLLIFAIFYFLLFMPMQRQKRQQKKMLEQLENGNVVQTSGGLLGTVVSINEKDDTLILRIKPDNVRVLVARSAVSGVISEK